MYLVEVIHDNLFLRGEICKRRLCNDPSDVADFVKKNAQKWTRLFNRLIVDIDYDGNGEVYSYVSQYERAPVFKVRTAKIGMIE